MIARINYTIKRDNRLNVNIQKVVLTVYDGENVKKVEKHTLEEAINHCIRAGMELISVNDKVSTDGRNATEMWFQLKHKE